MASTIPNGVQQFLDNNGNPLVGGRVHFYIPGTTTDKNTWQDPDLAILNTNPITLNARGEATIWGNGRYRQVVYDQWGNLIWDRLAQSSGADLDSEATNDLKERIANSNDSDKGAGMVGFQRTETYPPKTVGYELARTIRLLQETITVRVPSDYPTIQEAVDAASRNIPTANVKIIVLIEKGHRPKSGVLVENRDLSFIEIASEEDNKEIFLDPSFSGRFVDSFNSLAPILNAYVHGNGSAVERIYSLISSVGWVMSGAGGEETTGRPLYVNSGRVYAGESIWRRYGDSIYFSAGSSGQLGNATIEDVSVIANGALTVSRGSAVEAQGIKIKRCVYPIEVKRAGSSLNAHNSIIEDCYARVARITRGGLMSLTGATITGIQSNGIEVYGGRLEMGEGTQIRSSTGNGYGVHVNSASSVSAAGATISGFGTGAYIEGSANVDLAAITIENNSNVGIFAYRGAIVNASTATVRNNGQDARVSQGGQIVLVGATTTTSSTVGVPNVADTNVNGFGGFNVIAMSGRGIIWA